MPGKPIVELLVNPLCMEEADVCELGKICEELDIPLVVYNAWDINDEDFYEVPEYIASFLREVRGGLRPGSVYGNLFINGERFPLNLGESRLSGDWREKAREIVVNAVREGADD
jgi:hypothetical protein